MSEKEYPIQEAMRLAQSENGKKLADVLRKNDPEALTRAMESAAAGNMAQAAQILKGMVSNPEVKELLQKMGGQHG